MNARPGQLNFVLVSCLLSLVTCGPPRPDHEAEPAVELEPQSTTVFGDRVLLFMEYPHLVRGEPARFLAHLSNLADGEPVRSGHVTLEIGGTTLGVNAPRRDGLFIPEGSLPEAGRFPSRLIVQSPQVEETLDLGELVVHATGAEARLAAEAAAGEEPPGSVPFLMEQQWKLPLLLAEAGPRRLTQRLIVPARAVAAEGSSAIASPPIGGRVSSPVGGQLPRTGDSVEVGQVLAFVEPPLTAPEVAQLRALEVEFELRALEIEQAAADAAAQLRFGESELARLGELRKAGLSTQQQLEQAERDLAIARSAAGAAAEAKAALDRLRAGQGGDASGLPQQVAVTAPISGVVVEAGLVVGESVEAGARMYRIVDSSRMWIEGRLSEFDLPRISAAPEAVVTFPALPVRRFDLGQAGGGRLLHLAPEVDPESRTVVVRYEMPNLDGSVRAGMLADLELVVGTIDADVAIPLEAIVMDQGLPVAYVMLEGELFQKRDLILGERDGSLVEVRSGLRAGERVATRGSSTIRLASMSPASFGAGHAH